LLEIYSSSCLNDLSPNYIASKCILIKQLFDQKIKTYQKPLKTIYKYIILKKQGHKHKMHKRKEILKNSSKKTQINVIITRKRERKLVTPFNISKIQSKAKRIQKNHKH